MFMFEKGQMMMEGLARLSFADRFYGLAGQVGPA